ncbi:MAG: dienelactone hydrolase family protein [Planctomycetota bacterium]
MRSLVCFLLILFPGATVSNAEVRTKTVTYDHAGVTLKGHLAWDDANKEKRPGVLVVHEFWGLNDYARKRAEQLAGLGYVAIAVDMYGDGKMTDHPQEAGAMAGQVRENLATWLGRANAGLMVLRECEFTDPKRIAAIGYCFGGSTVLQLAYSGADISAAVSFHGSLPIPDSTKDIKARILICHGAKDTFIPEETIKSVRTKLDDGKVNYKFVAYPDAVHSFTVPDAEKRGMNGVAYNAEADRQSWQDMTRLFSEVFGGK